MPVILLTTIIKAPIQICFDLSRSIELHQQSVKHTNEKAVAGRTSGLCTKGDIITWRAKHFGLYRYLTVQVTKMNAPTFFEDRMIKGDFKSFIHQHFFEEVKGITTMKDEFQYEVPYGFAGKIFDRLLLKTQMIKLLAERNGVIKLYSESGRNYKE